LALCWISFFGNYWIASKEGVKHMPALQLAAIRQFIGGFIYIAFFLQNTLAQRETMENHIYFVVNFVLSNGPVLGRKIHQ
jgi:hypothetical protein